MRAPAGADPDHQRGHHGSHRLRRGEDRADSKDEMVASFAAGPGGPCPARQLCTSSKSGRCQITIGPRELFETQAAGRAPETTSSWQADYARRAGVEDTLRQAVAVTGSRHARCAGCPEHAWNTRFPPSLSTSSASPLTGTATPRPAPNQPPRAPQVAGDSTAGGRQDRLAGAPGSRARRSRARAWRSIRGLTPIRGRAPGRDFHGPRVLPGERVDAAPPGPRGYRVPAAGAQRPGGAPARARARGGVAVGTGSVHGGAPDCPGRHQSEDGDSAPRWPSFGYRPLAALTVSRAIATELPVVAESARRTSPVCIGRSRKTAPLSRRSRARTGLR